MLPVSGGNDYAIDDLAFHGSTGASLNLAKNGSPASVNSGEDVTYTISFDNPNPFGAHAVEIVDILPDNTMFVSATGGTGGWDYEYTPGPSRKVTWDIGNLPSGSATQSVKVVVRVLAPPGSRVSNSCEIVSRETVTEEATAITNVNPTLCMGTLEADIDTLSTRNGNKIVNFTLSTDQSYAMRNYILFGSVSGTMPGTPLPHSTVVLPLNLDYFTDVTLIMQNTSTFWKFASVFDWLGRSRAKLDITDKILSPGCEGLILYFAFATYDPWDCASNPVGIEIIQ